MPRVGLWLLGQTHLLESNAMTAEMVAYLWTLTDAKAAGLVLGTTGSGKATMLPAQAGMTNPRRRIMTMENVLEMRMPHADAVRLEARDGDGNDANGERLISMPAPHRPDYFMVGDARRGNMGALFRPVKGGCGGAVSLHGSGPNRRLSA